MKILCSHSDLDGVGPLIINDFYGINFDKVYIISYEDIKDNQNNFIFPNNFSIRPEDEVTVTDISMMPELYEYIKTAKSYIIFDHHDETALIVDDPNVTYSKTKSGSLLYFEYITKGQRVPLKLKKFIDLVNTYDTFNDASPLWEEAQNLNRIFYKIYSYGLKNRYEAVQRFIQIQVRKLNNKLVESFFFSDYEKSLIQEVIQKENELFQKAKKEIKTRKDNVGNTFGVIVLPSKISIVCFNLLNTYKGLDYIIAINSYRGINGKVSVRAQKEGKINVNYLTGIKGHEKAGGGEFPIDFLRDFWESNSYLDYNMPETA